MSKNLVWHEGKVSHQDRCRLMGQEGMVVWFTGLSGSGKSTIAAELELKLIRRGRFVYRLDGDNVRHGLNSDLGFSPEDRDENIRRVAEVAALFKDAGFIVLVSFISPYRAMREFARSKAGENFIEVYVQAGLETCQRRDPKSLYKKAAAGELSEFTGISSPYEEPEHPEIVLDTDELSIEAAVDKVLSVVLKRLETD